MENPGHFILMKIIVGRKMEFASLYVNVLFVELIEHPILTENLEFEPHALISS